MWTLTNRAANPGAARRSLARTSTERAKKSSSGPARLTRYEAWIATGWMSSATSRSRKAGPSLGGAARRRQAVGLSAKIWSAVAPISCARSTALTMPRPNGRWAPRRRPSGSIRGMVRRADAAPRWPGRSRPSRDYRRPDAVRSVAARAVPAALRVLAADDGLDHAQVAVIALVQDGDPFGLGVDEHEEAMAELLHPPDGVLLEHRLDREALHLDDPALARRPFRAVGKLAQDLLLLLGSGPQARLLLVVDCLPLDLVDHVVERLLVARPRGAAAQLEAVDQEGDLGEVGVRGAAVLLAPELDRGVGAIVGQPVDPLELSLGIVADPVRDLGVLALDDRPHGSPPG